MDKKLVDEVSRRILFPSLVSVALLLSACTPVALVNALVPADTYVRTQGLAYGELQRQRLDVYVSATQRGTGDRPVVLFFYGGAWTHGDRGDFLFVGEALASKGWVAVVADYRVYPEAVFPAFVEDGAQALRWIQQNVARFGGDPRRVFLMGHSAGAHIAMMLATDAKYLEAAGARPADLAGVIGLAGPYDFLPLRSRRMKAIFGEGEEALRGQPIRYATGREPPLLLLTGESDGVVNPGNTLRLAQRVRELGGQVETRVYPEHSHRSLIGVLAAPLRRDGGVLDDIERFVQLHVGASRAVSVQDPRAEPCTAPC